MLTKLGRRGYTVSEGRAEYAAWPIDADSDTDPDADEKARANDRRTKPLHLTAARRRR